VVVLGRDNLGRALTRAMESLALRRGVTPLHVLDRRRRMPTRARVCRTRRGPAEGDIRTPTSPVYERHASPRLEAPDRFFVELRTDRMVAAGSNGSRRA